jgi:hypothetical protein
MSGALVRSEVEPGGEKHDNLFLWFCITGRAEVLPQLWGAHGIG